MRDAVTLPLYEIRTGNDANSCVTTALPCPTLAGALTKRMAGGEIDVLDSGTFNLVTMNKAVTIDGGAGSIASITFSSSGTSITISTGRHDAVRLRNLSSHRANVAETLFVL